MTISLRAFFALLIAATLGATVISTLTIVFMVNWSARWEIGALRRELGAVEVEVARVTAKWGDALTLLGATQDSLRLARAAMRRRP